MPRLSKLHGLSFTHRNAHLLWQAGQCLRTGSLHLDEKPPTLKGGFSVALGWQVYDMPT